MFVQRFLSFERASEYKLVIEIRFDLALYYTGLQGDGRETFHVSTNFEPRLCSYNLAWNI